MGDSQADAIMSAREEANIASLAKHLEECRASDQAHLLEQEVLRKESEKYKDNLYVWFWERKRRITQALRDKANQKFSGN